MKVSVVICTWNRARLLADTLRSLQAVAVPDSVSWEVVVVNNNSTDDTNAVIEAYAAHLPMVPLFEARPGKSYAANLGAQKASGDLLIWTDDDVRFDPGWLSAYVAAASAWPSAGFFAGPIDAVFEAEPPSWIARHLAELSGVYVSVNYGRDERELRSGDSVFGANMAFRTDVARRFPLKTDLGRIRGSLIGADDTELIARVTGAGVSGRWIPGARVQHFNAAERGTKAYVLKWYRDAGRSLVRQGMITAGGPLGVPPWLLRQYLFEVGKRHIYALGAGPKWFAAFRQSTRLEGAIRELLKNRSR